MAIGRALHGEEWEVVGVDLTGEEMVLQEVVADEEIGMNLEGTKGEIWMVLLAEVAVFWEVALLVVIGGTMVEIEVGDMTIK